MVYTILLVVCLAGSARPCEVREQIVHDLSAHPAMAYVQAQARVAQWLEDHPRYVVQRWSVKPGRSA